MEWSKLLNTSNFGHAGKATERAERPNYVQAADRITFSAPFRRLANKTQVHPLYDHDHLRHRMIHSEEVASVGRSLGMQIGIWLSENEDGFSEIDAHRLAGIVYAACLAHDIGNPPFGHSGEEAIGKWCHEALNGKSQVFTSIDNSRWREFEKFEGNAQGFRILTRLETYRNDGGMRMPYAVLGAFMKYPMCANTSKELEASTPEEDLYVGAKKFGFFGKERDYFADAARELGLPEMQSAGGMAWWKRHPLVYIVEAADDICYNIVDLEDGVVSGDLSYADVESLLDKIALPPSSNPPEYNLHEKISYLRARAIGGGIKACVEAFKENYAEIMNGTFSSSLLDESKKSGEFSKIKEFARVQLFTSPRKTKLEVQGRNVIRNVLDGLCPVYDALSKVDWCESGLPDYEKQLVAAVGLDLRDVDDAYTALHSMTDFVSGMTDRYAVSTSRMLSGG